MKKIPEIVSRLLKDHGFVVVSTLDRSGLIHCSAKGVIEAKKENVYLIDLYKRVTYSNLQRDPTISITVIDEDDFIGFVLKGRAKIIKRGEVSDKLIKKWENKLLKRISKRIVKDIKKDKESAKHPESKFPLPEYLIKMEVEQIIDLTPTHLKEPVLD